MPLKAPHLGALALIAVLATSPAAQAAVTLQSYLFTTSTHPFIGETATFTIAYDDLTNAYSLHDLDFKVPGGAYFDMTNGGLAPHSTLPDVYLIGGLIYGVEVLDLPGPDFRLAFRPTLAEQQTSVSYAGGSTYGLRGRLERLPSAVPEPSTWAMMITGFGAAGALLRRRRAHALAA